MKRRVMLLMGIWMMTVPVFTAFAGETVQEPAESAGAEVSTAAESAGTEAPASEDSIGGLIAGLFSDDGPLKDVVPEDTDLSGLVSGLFSEDSPLKDVLPENTDLAGLVAGLLSEEGLLKDVLPEGTDISGLVDSAKEHLGKAGDEISEVLGKAVDTLKEKTGDIDLDTVKEYAGSLVSHLLGSEDVGDGSLDDTIRIYGLIREAEENFILEHNAGIMDSGDVQIIGNSNVYLDQFDVDPIQSLNVMIQYNYTTDEENNLRFLSGAEDIVLFAHQNNGDENYQVVASTFSEDGENYMPSIEAMCSEVGEPVDDCLNEIEAAGIMIIYDLETYLKEHPELAGIEFEGEIRTVEELDKLFYERLAELYPADEEEIPEEETAEE